MRRLPDPEILNIYERLSHLLKRHRDWNFPHYLEQQSLFVYEDGERRAYIIFPFDDLSQLDNETRQKILELIKQYELKFRKNCLEVTSKLIAKAVFKSLAIISHKKFLISKTNVVFFQRRGNEASHTGSGLSLNYKLFVNLVNHLINENKRKALEEIEYITTQIAHELTHVVYVEDGPEDEYDNILYGWDIFADGIARFSEYIVSSLLFNLDFTNQIEDAARYIQGIEKGYHQPSGKRYWLGLYICLIIFIDKFREEIKFIEELNRFPQMNFDGQIDFLKHFRKCVRKNRLRKEFISIGQAVRAELIECKELKNLLILFHKAEKSLNLKKRLQNV